MRKSVIVLGLLVSASYAAPTFAQSAASPYTTAYRYDAMRRMTGTISPDPDGGSPYTYIAVRNTYDAAGRLTKVENGVLGSWQSELVVPANWGAAFQVYTTVETAYDAMDRKIRETTNGSNEAPISLTQYSYDSAGRLECTAVRMNPAIYGSLPSSACTLGAQGSHGPDRITKNIYDAAGQLLQVREGVGTAVEAAEVTYTYTNNSKIKYVIDGAGNRAEKRYDGHDRQVRWVFPSAAKPGAFNDSSPANAVATAGALNESDYEEYGYDAGGNRTSLRKRDGSTLTFAYDALNRVTFKSVPGSTTHTRDVYYGYDLRGLQTYARFDSASGEGISFVYDGVGRKTQETLVMDGASRTIASDYDANGNRIRLTYPDGNYVNYYRDGLNRLYYADMNGANPLFYPPYDAAGRVAYLNRWNPSAGTWGAVTGFSYDPASRVSAYWHDLTNTSHDSTTSFTRNPAGQLATRSRTNDLYAWTGAVTTTRSYAANGLNQYTAVGGYTFAHDANGNLTSDGTNTYTYDVENRLITRTGGASATLRYDPLGRLYEVAGASGITRFLYDGDAMVAEYNSSGTMLRRFVHGPAEGVDDPLVWYEGSSIADGARRQLFADEQGSVNAVTDTYGTVIQVNSYDEYGIPAAGNLGRFQYTGQAWIPELGMYHYKARIYSPTLGRFLQTDPIGYEDQFNLYAYVANDPVNMVDPTGQWGWLVKLVKEGVKKVARVSREDAVKARRGGQNVQARSRQEARQIERQVSDDPSKLKRHKGHDLRDGDGNPTGQQGRPHYQTEGQQGHTFWSVAGALTVLNQTLDVVDQLTNPFHTTVLGDGTCPASGCGQPMLPSEASSGSETDAGTERGRSALSKNGSGITGCRAKASRVDTGC